MKTQKIHLIVGTVICAATVLLFLAFYNRLPENVVIQITIDGSAGNSLPKPLFVFGMPAVLAVVNLIKGFQLAQKDNPSVIRFYIVPGIAVVLSVLALIIGLSL